ncbi:MAG: type IV pilus twitching motility protein PilT [Tepidisphaeraceae bacterium]
MIHEILKHAVHAKASDVHLHAGCPPLLRIDTVIQAASSPALNAESTARIAKILMGEHRWSEFEQKRDMDFSHDSPGLGRFRVNAHFQRGTVALAIRIIDSHVRQLAELHLPEIVEKLTRLPRGLILVAGPTGCGKSTTLAAMIDVINHRERGHIVTLEDPIEFVFENDQCVIEQREVGPDVPNFASGLRHVLRQDPDVILLGEMRDLETTSAAVTAAETGHLVLSTMHTCGAAQTVERILDVYPSSEQNQIRTLLAGALVGVISQTLLKRSDEAGMIPAIEVMVCTPAVQNCIRENRIFEIANIIETNRALGMQSMDYSIKQLYSKGYVSRAEAVGHSVHPEKLERQLVA